MATKTKTPKVSELVRASGLNLEAQLVAGDAQFVRLTYSGPAAKLPSVSNNRLTMLDTRKVRRVARECEWGKTAHGELHRAIAELRARSLRNPAHMAVLGAMRALYDSVLAGRRLAFAPKQRVFCLVLMGDVLNRHDSHNIVKAACDFVEDVGLVTNDSLLDALALHRKHWAQPGPETEIVLCPTTTVRTWGLGAVLDQINQTRKPKDGENQNRAA